jgi:hypothetical protein
MVLLVQQVLDLVVEVQLLIMRPVELVLQILVEVVEVVEEELPVEQEALALLKLHIKQTAQMAYLLRLLVVLFLHLALILFTHLPLMVLLLLSWRQLLIRDFSFKYKKATFRGKKARDEVDKLKRKIW